MSAPKTRRSLSITLREAGAFLNQARYLSRDLRPSSRLGMGPTVVLLHGLYATAGVLHPLRKRLETALSASTYSLSYAPGPGILELAERVQVLLSRIEPSGPIHFVGHSLGGLVLRYVARQGHDPRVTQTISLAAPFHGSRKHWLVPGQAGRDMQPSSTLLEALREPAEVDQTIPHLTLVAEEDQLILPPATPGYGEIVRVPRAGHNGIIFSELAIERVVSRVAHGVGHHPETMQP